MSTDNLSGGAEGTIPVQEAMDMTTNWRNYLASSKETFNVRSYRIPVITFQNILLNNPDAEAVRAYIGLTDPADPTTSQLIFVPIVDGKDVPYVKTNTGPGLGDDGDSNVYDFTVSCPPNCDAPSGGLDG